MKLSLLTPGLLTTLALLPLTARAATFTWDGGGANDNILTAANWNPDAVPVSNVATTDLVFQGSGTPTFTSAFSAKSVTFSNIGVTIHFLQGTPVLTIGAGGITNNASQTQFFEVPVTFAATTTPLTTNVDGLNFRNTVNIGSGTINNSGDFVSFSSITGTGTLNQNGFGILSFRESFSDFTGTLRANDGGLNFSGDVGTTQSLSGAGTIVLAASTAFGVSDGHTLALRNGAQMTEAAGNSIFIGTAATLRLEGGSDLVAGGNLTIAHSGSTSAVGSVVVTGAGSTIQTGAGTLTVKGATTVSLQSGGSAVGAISVIEGATLQVQSGASAAGLLSIGAGTPGALAVDGAGSTINPASGPNLWGSNGGSATVTFSNAATATFPGVQMASTAGVTTLAQVLSGAVIGSSGSLTISNATAAGAAGTLVVSGAGSAWNQALLTTTAIGAASGGTGTLTVSDGGTFTTGVFSTTIGATGTLNISGGTFTASGAFTNGGTLNFTSGTLNLLGSNNLTVGAGGLLGVNLTLLSDRALAIGGTTTIDAGRTLTLNGGAFRTGALVTNGTLDFQRGTLGITGSGGLNIGNGLLGASPTLGTGSRLEVSSAATIPNGSTLTVNGGGFTAGSLVNSGTLRANLGLASVSAVTNNSGGRIFAGDTLLASGAWNNAAGSRLTLENDGLVAGAGTISNAGLVNGHGTIATGFNNNTGGEVRAESGRTLYFLGTTGSNAGRFNLQDGTLVFAQPLTVAAGGQINGSGDLHVPATPVPTSGAPAAGLNVSGQVNLSGGDSFVFGTVAMNAGSRLIASGGATATFFDVFRHSGAEVKASAGSALAFFGEVRGPGSFTGTGTIYMEGGYSPGSSPASVSLAPQMVFTNSNVLTLEIGGLTPGSQHDKLTFTHAATPQVEWGGALEVTLIGGFAPAAGQSFDVLDFDAAKDAGAFSSITLPALAPGLTWDTRQLYTTGLISVVPAGLTFAAWATASGIPGALPDGDHDHDGYDNATEFALGLFPPQPGTALPDGGLHTYIDGERLRLLFTRPLDRTGVTLVVQASDDLVTWTDVATSVNSGVFSGPGFVTENRAHPLPGPGLVEVRDILTTATAPRRQMRLHVMLAP